MPFFPFFGDDQRGKAVAWSLFGSATATASQHTGNNSTVQSLNTSVDELKQLIGNGASLTSAVAGFLGDHQLAEKAGNLQRMLK